MAKLSVRLPDGSIAPIENIEKSYYNNKEIYGKVFENFTDFMKSCELLVCAESDFGSLYCTRVSEMSNKHNGV